MTDDDRALLEFEETHPRNDGRKEGAIREAFGLSAARYYQRLRRIVVDPAAIAAFPVVTGRVQRRMRDLAAKRAARSL